MNESFYADAMTPERCTHDDCDDDADDRYSFDNGLTRLCTDHGVARELADTEEEGE